jgi:hypothetical protein
MHEGDPQQSALCIGNPGPGLFTVVREWQPRARRAKFRWERTQLRHGQRDHEVGDSITVQQGALLNISVYRPGDYKQFFQDHRTRAKYLQWAPLLLAAEDSYGGRLTPSMKGPDL